MKKLLGTLGLVLGFSMPALAGPVGPPAGNYVTNVSTKAGVNAVNLGPGTVTVPPLVLKAGTSTTVPSTGAFEWNGTQLTFTDGNSNNQARKYLPLFGVSTTDSNGVQRLGHSFINYLTNPGFEFFLNGVNSAPNGWTNQGLVWISSDSRSTQGNTSVMLGSTATDAGIYQDLIGANKTVWYSYSLQYQYLSGPSTYYFEAQADSSPFTVYQQVPLTYNANSGNNFNFATLSFQKPNDGINNVRFKIAQETTANATTTYILIDESMLQEGGSITTAYTGNLINGEDNQNIYASKEFYGAPDMVYGTGVNFHDSGNANKVTLSAPPVLAQSAYTVTLPTAPPSATQPVYMSTSGALITGPAVGGGGGGGPSVLPLAQGATNYIQMTSTLQSGATFYVSSGTAKNLTAVVLNSPAINIPQPTGTSSSYIQLSGSGNQLSITGCTDTFSACSPTTESLLSVGQVKFNDGSIQSTAFPGLISLSTGILTPAIMTSSLTINNQSGLLVTGTGNSNIQETYFNSTYSVTSTSITSPVGNVTVDNTGSGIAAVTGALADSTIHTAGTGRIVIDTALNSTTCQ